MGIMQSNPATRSTTATRRAANPPRYLHVSAYARMLPMPITGSKVTLEFQPWIESPGVTFMPFGPYDRKAWRRGNYYQPRPVGRNGTFEPRELER